MDGGYMSELAQRDHTAHSDRPAGVTFRDVAYSYTAQGPRIVEGLSLDIAAGEFVSIVGASGCGKTTLLRLVSGLAVPTAGVIEQRGQRIVGPSPDVSLVFQADTLLPWRTASRNVGLGLEGKVSREEVRRRSQEMLARVGLGDSGSRYPHQLSGGMRQRVNLARALVMRPGVLLMDEPFAALDAQTKEAQQEHLLEVWSGDLRPTVLFVTHDIEEAVFLADRVVVLAKAPRGVVAIEDCAFQRPRRLELKAEPDFTATVIKIKSVIRQQQD
jgi:ABC-type nitrate/sulfonate/bicarbonate transport system ATPase subunit